jgi:uncharacterized protein (TIGR00255 family)
MTAYSRARAASSTFQFVIEIHSVNRKMLDMSLYLPKDFLRYDVEIRKWLGGQIERGQVTLRLTMQGDGMDQKLFSKQLKALKEKWDTLANELGFDPKKMVDLPFLVSQLQTVSIESEEDEELKTVLKKTIETALYDLIHMKEVEGKALVLDIEKRLKLIEENVNAVELKKEIPLAHYRKKLLERLKEVGSLEMDDRVVAEVAILAGRMDVTEELVRLRAHLQQFHQHLRSQEKAIGRTLDFLTQEMLREINTLGSKSADSEISSFVVKMKSELDKIREQVQNIE